MNHSAGKPDFVLEKSRARCGGKDGGPVHEMHTEANLKLLDEVCFIPFRRTKHEADAMMNEIVRQGLTQSRPELKRTASGKFVVEPEAEPALEPEPEIHPALESNKAHQVA